MTDISFADAMAWFWGFLSLALLCIRMRVNYYLNKLHEVNPYTAYIALEDAGMWSGPLLTPFAIFASCALWLIFN